MTSNSIANTPDQHGFIMAGTSTVYICHLPMFNMQNHMYQVTLQVQIPPDALSVYLKDKETHPDTFYVLGNLQTDLFTIPDIMLGKTTSFKADIFRGMPDDPNKDTPLIHDIETIIERIVYARHFDYSIPYPEPLTYIIFGNGQETFLDHYLTREEDFMNLIELNKVPDWLPPDLLAISSNLGFTGYPGTTVPENCPLNPGTYTVTFQGQEESYPVEVGKSFFFDTEIINMPAEQPMYKVSY